MILLRTLLSGLVLVNPATSYARSALSRIGPFCAKLPQPAYLLSLLLLAALVLEPAMLPAFVVLILGLRQPGARALCHPRLPPQYTSRLF